MRRKTVILLISFLSAAVVALGILAFTGQSRARQLEYYARASTEHAFEELVTSLSELSDSLEKSIYISDPALQSALCTQVYGRAVLAQMAMGLLPYESQELEQTAGFVSRVGDYACVLSKTVGANGGYSAEELENLQNLSDTASSLAQNLRDMRWQMSNGLMQMDSSLDQNDGMSSDAQTVTLSGSIADIENEFPELPTLIYDGPFSDGIRSHEMHALEGLEEVSAAQARQVAARALAVSETEVFEDGECAGDVPCWRFTANLSGGVYTVQVTKQGGKLLSVLCARAVGEPRYSAKEGLAMAQKLLTELGYENMRESYYIEQNGVLTVNYEYEQDGVLCYPDLVKLGVALDTGALMSFDALGYLSAHRERELPAPQVSPEEAAASVSDLLTVDSINLAVIPMEGGQEKLCYELVCSGGEHRCILYVNAVSGAQERILLLLEEENGTLTI